jgi:carbon-monoxide dehydrogenase catalytic subunit
MSETKKSEETQRKTIDPAAEEMLDRAAKHQYSTMFSRVDEIRPCPIGAEGACCKFCSMGPCRITGQNREGKTGVCGVTLSTMAARNLARAIASGTSAHSDHGRDLALTLLAVAEGKTKDYQIKDVDKLHRVAGYMGIEVAGRTTEQIAYDVAKEALDNFGRQLGEVTYVSRAPIKRQEVWKQQGVTPRGVDREVVETMHRTHPGTDQDPENILDQAIRTSLGSGWGGSMLATDLTDILFGTPWALRSKANLGVLKDDQVNLIVHGHDPVLSEMIVVAASDPELIDYAKSKGAKGINLAGICCTANEILMRNGIPVAGNYLHQELAIITGAVEAMVVDVQCVIQALAKLAENFHTKLITTSPKAKIPGATHISFEHDNALETAKKIVKLAIDNFSNRGEVQIPQYSNKLIAGFSHEYIRYMLGGKYRASFRPLNDNVINGKIQGLAAIVGCNNPRTVQDEGIINIAKELIANNVLVAVTGCAAGACGKYGLLAPETLNQAGDSLKEVCEAIGISPIIHLGSCVDNSRILTVLTEVVEEGGLGEDISDLPAVGICPEWYCEKALEIGAYCVGSGVYVLFGGAKSPVSASQEVTELISSGWESKFGGKLEFVSDWQEIVSRSLDHIQKKRKALGIDVAKERVLYDMEARRKLSV